MNISEKAKIIAVKNRLMTYRNLAQYIEDSMEPSIDEVNDAERMKQTILSLTAELGACKERNVINRKYIYGQSWRTICKEMDLSESYSKKLYKDGMIKLYEIMERRSFL